MSTKWRPSSITTAKHWSIKTRQTDHTNSGTRHSSSGGNTRLLSTTPRGLTDATSQRRKQNFATRDDCYLANMIVEQEPSWSIVMNTWSQLYYHRLPMLIKWTLCKYLINVCDYGLLSSLLLLFCLSHSSSGAVSHHFITCLFVSSTSYWRPTWTRVVCLLVVGLPVSCRWSVGTALVITGRYHQTNINSIKLGATWTPTHNSVTQIRTTRPPLYLSWNFAVLVGPCRQFSDLPPHVRSSSTGGLISMDSRITSKDKIHFVHQICLNKLSPCSMIKIAISD